MTSCYELLVRGDFDKDELASVIQARFPETFWRVDEYRDRYCWGLTYDDHFTCIGDNIFTSGWYDPLRYPVAVSFHDVRLGRPERDEWIDRAWDTWLAWLVEAGAHRVMLIYELGGPLRQWRLPSLEEEVECEVPTDNDEARGDWRGARVGEGVAVDVVRSRD